MSAKTDGGLRSASTIVPVYAENERLVGELKKGGKLAGKITGSIAGQKPPFNWDLDFDLSLPQSAAGAGPSC